MLNQVLTLYFDTIILYLPKLSVDAPSVASGDMRQTDEIKTTSCAPANIHILK